MSSLEMVLNIQVEMDMLIFQSICERKKEDSQEDLWKLFFQELTKEAKDLGATIGSNIAVEVNEKN